MRNPIFSMAYCLLCILAVQTTYAVPKFFAVGVYDPAEQVNAVDKSAPYDPDYSTGTGMNEALIMEVDDFSPLILEAFTNGQGGVINFDNGLIEAGRQTDSFAAFFDGKAVLFESTDDIRNDYVSSSRTPISGPGKSPNGGFLAKSTAMGDVCTSGGSYQLTLKEYRFEPGERIRAVAGTILGRNNSDKDGKWTMKVTLDNGDIVAASASIDMSAGNAVDDTFFGAYAPAGRHITGVSWMSYSGEFSGLDDLTFITGITNFSLPRVESEPAMQPPAAESWDSSDRSDYGDTTLFGRDKIIW